MVGPEASGVLARPILLLWRVLAGQIGGATSVEVGPSSQEVAVSSGYEPRQRSRSKRGYLCAVKLAVFLFRSLFE
jgi:hypothetical protein